MRTRSFLLAVSAPLFLALTAGCDKDEPVVDDDGDGYTTLLDCDDENFEERIDLPEHGLNVFFKLEVEALARNDD